MDQIGTNPPRGEKQILARAMQVLQGVLPPGWTAGLSNGDRETDGELFLVASDGTRGRMSIEARSVVEGRDVSALRDRLTVNGQSGLVAARYIPSSVRERLTGAGLSYVDATGNAVLALERPGIFIRTQGADRDPWRGPGRPRGTLKGDPAARAVRALLDFSGAWTIRNLMDVSGVSTGSLYRVLEFLQSDGLVERQPNKEYVVGDWATLLRRWSEDYGFVRSSETTTWIAARGLESFAQVASQSTANLKYAFTGTIAAQEWASYAPARNAMVYVADVEACVSRWNLRPADAGANVVLAVPQTAAVFDRTESRDRDGLIIAAPAQVAVDLLTGPGRAPSEGEELIEWMRANESSWRR